MTFEKVNALLIKLNAEVFYSSLIIESWPKDASNDGEWTLVPEGQDPRYSYRQCWLEGRQHFEMRHGGGSDFLWWIDQVICDAVRREFNGTWRDEGCSEILTDPVPLVFRDYLRLHNQGRPRAYRLALEFLRSYNEVPKAYTEGLKRARGAIKEIV